MYMIKFRKITSFFLLIMFLTVSVFGVTKSDYLELIGRVWKNKNYKKGITALNQAVIKYPGEMKFYYHLSFFYQYARDFQKAYTIGKKGYERFKNNQKMGYAYKNALLNYGWRLYQSGNRNRAYVLFDEAYKIDDNDQWVLNAYGVSMRDQKKYLKAVVVLEKGYRLFPKNPYIGDNLAWTFWAMGEKELAANQKEQAYVYYKKAYDVYSHKKTDMAISFLYKLIYFKKWNEGKKILEAAGKKFQKKHQNFFEVTYWMIFNRAKEAFEKKDFQEMIEDYKKLYAMAFKKDKIWKRKMSFSDLAMLNLNFRIMDMISGICPYYKKLKPEQREELLGYLKILKKGLDPKLKFIQFRLTGHILYRSNKIIEAQKDLDKAYQEFQKTPFWKKEQRKVMVDFPLKGIYYAGGNESSKAITHMGLNRFCYDITGADKKGRSIKPGRTGKRVGDYYGFGKIIYSPVDGLVSNFESKHPDDPIGKIPYRSKGNHLQIKSGGFIYHFVHLKQGSVMVKKGERVKKGQPIARLGNSSSAWPHLHFCVYSGDWMSSLPLRFTVYRLLKNGKSKQVKNGRPGETDGFDLIKVR